jgi:hypothetical protein
VLKRKSLLLDLLLSPCDWARFAGLINAKARENREITALQAICEDAAPQESKGRVRGKRKELF